MSIYSKKCEIEEGDMNPILIKLKNSAETKYVVSEKSLLELPIKSKNLISFKLRYMRVYERFILIFKIKTASKPHSIIFFDSDLKLEWTQPFSFRFSKGTQILDYYVCEMKDTTDLMKVLNFKCNLLNFHGTYKAIKKIGKGSFASVYLVTKKDSEKRFAVKSFNKEHICSQEKGKAALLNEINIMRLLQHPNIINLNEVYETDHSYYMIMELLEGGSLKDRISQEKIESDAIFSIMLGTLRGLNYMHQKGVMHRDIKPENILFRSNGNSENDVCIADLGLSSFVNEQIYLFFRCGTPGFVAPEIINLKDENAHYTEKCDLFSLGIIYHLLLLGKSPFESNKYSCVVEKNKNCKIDFNDSLYDNIKIQEKNLLMKLLEPDPEKRISAEVAIYELNQAKNSIIENKLEKTELKQKSPIIEKNEKEMQPSEASGSPFIKRTYVKKISGVPSDSNETEEKVSLPFVMRTVIMNGLSNTIEGLPVCSETEEKHTKLKRGLSIKIYRFPTMDIQSPNMRASLESSLKGEDKRTPETLPEPNCNNHLLSIKENEEEEEKKLC